MKRRKKKKKKKGYRKKGRNVPDREAIHRTRDDTILTFLWKTMPLSSR